MSNRVPPPPAGGAGALLPPDSGRDRPLFVVAAILVFLACIAALGARGAWLQAQNWTSDLESSITIQIRPIELRDAQLDAEEAARIALTVPGILGATAHDRAHAEALLAPWLGAGNLPDDLPLPLMVEVQLDPQLPPPGGALQAALDAAGLTATVDDNSRWAGAVRRAARTAQTLGLAMMFLLAGAAAAVVAFAARASLAARINVIDALHICGAEDRFVAGLFERRFFMLGLKAGIAGAACAGLVAVLASFGQGPADMAFFLPHWAMDPFELALLLLAPVLAGTTAAISARLAVASDLRGRW
ncbi:cell division protein FtsX [Maricaulis sp.]|uniref:cell division protein FtsX n=1 Tax=Maricaulis sp. TaxID=1486257 RepID=UPI003A8D75FE|tara:strand:+ start:547 stop:1452 length:906 start_codon:yes stop_codon:yes gene_type:complete